MVSRGNKNGVRRAPYFQRLLTISSTTPFRPINTKFEVTIDDEVDNDRDTVYLLTRRVGVAPALALCDSDSSDVVMWM